MKTYLVGGAVREMLLKRPVTERDWVVVGATPEDMLRRGFRPVGRDFPVFLHPETHEEYALARTERKVRPGYTGFVFHAAPEVTLEEDLRRRDLTINAMAMDDQGLIIDPYGGQRDLQARLLQHVSPAFAEDPVRILRVARFAARYQPLGFQVAPETQQLMQKMVQQGEAAALTAERVWQEFQRALAEPAPQAFFQVLADCDALKPLFPEIAAHFLQLAFPDSEQQPPPIIHFAHLCLPLQKQEMLTLCQRYRAPVRYRQLALLANRVQPYFQQTAPLSPEQIMELLNQSDAWRRPEQLTQLFAIFANSAHLQKIQQGFSQAQQTSAAALLATGLSGAALGKALAAQRLQAIRNCCQQHS